MKNLKLYLLLAASISVNIAICQAREDQTSVSFSKKSELLFNITGWAFNNGTGKWISNPSVIDPYSCPNCLAKDGATYEYRQNVRWLQIGIIQFSGKKYFVLENMQEHGEYKYPALKEEWIHHTVFQAFVMDEQQYQQLKSQMLMKDSKISEIYATTVYAEHVVTEEALLENIREALISNLQTQKEYFRYNVQAISGKDIVRFRMPEKDSSTESFSKTYFESSAEDFMKLFVE